MALTVCQWKCFYRYFCKHNFGNFEVMFMILRNLRKCIKYVEIHDFSFCIKSVRNFESMPSFNQKKGFWEQMT